MMKTKLFYLELIVFASLAFMFLSGCETLPKEQDHFEQDFNTSLPKERVKQIIQKAESGDVEAQFEMGMMYYYGRGVLQDYNEAIKWYRKAAGQGLLTRISQVS